MLGCDCNSAVACSLVCQAKSGFASLCGADTFTASNPVRLFRTQTRSGENKECNYGSNACTCGTTPYWRTAREKISGAYKFDADTCAVTNTQISEVGGYIYGGDCSDIALTATYPLAFRDYYAGNLVLGLLSVCGNADRTGSNIVVEETQITWGPDLFGCVNDTLCNECLGTRRLILSDEDTDADAIRRANAVIAGWTGCNCGTADCTAWVQDRTGTGSTTLGYRSIQTQVQWTALASRSYDVTVNFGRRILGSGGPFLDLGMQYEVTVASGPEGGTTVTSWIDVPTEAGFETVALTCLVEIQPL